MVRSVGYGLPCALLLALVGWSSAAGAAEPLTLAAALRSAAGTDETIGIGEQELALARAEVLDQTSSLLPTLEFSGGTGRTGDDLAFLFGQSATSATEYAFWRAETLLTAPLLAPADIGDLVVASRSLDARKQQQRLVLYDVLYGVVRTYYEALSAHQAVDVPRAGLPLERQHGHAPHHLVEGHLGRVGRQDQVVAEEP